MSRRRSQRRTPSTGYVTNTVSYATLYIKCTPDDDATVFDSSCTSRLNAASSKAALILPLRGAVFGASTRGGATRPSGSHLHAIDAIVHLEGTSHAGAAPPEHAQIAALLRRAALRELLGELLEERAAPVRRRCVAAVGVWRVVSMAFSRVWCL